MKNKIKSHGDEVTGSVDKKFPKVDSQKRWQLLSASVFKRV